MVLSLGVATTGICAPIALSFVLGRLVDASPLQCFAAGAALCSTSLGTTFAVLRSSGLSTTRLGVVLTSAAMLDDVVGLVMVQVISNLGAGGASVSSVTAVRPVLVSIAFAAATVLVCRFLVNPTVVLLSRWRAMYPDGFVNVALDQRGAALSLHTALLVGLVVGASYAGTSNLFAAYIAGVAISWWDSLVPDVGPSGARETVAAQGHHRQDEQSHPLASPLENPPASRGRPSLTGSSVFAYHYSPALKLVLQPFFFASIGFSIPVTRMFSAYIVWRGLVYAVLMLLGKVLCGLWLVRFPAAMAWITSRTRNYWLGGFKVMKRRVAGSERQQSTSGDRNRVGTAPSSTGNGDERHGQESHEIQTLPEPHETTDRLSADSAVVDSQDAAGRVTMPDPAKPLSLYPAAIVGLGMVARGEIGFLISSLAQSNGVFGVGRDQSESDIFLVVTWAIFICTIVGPLSVGLLVRRARRLERVAIRADRQGHDHQARDVLGVWGVS